MNLKDMAGSTEQIFSSADTWIVITSAESPLCAEMLKMLRAPGTLSSGAADIFEGSWRIYRSLYADQGGPIGLLIHRWLKSRGPVLAMGEVSQVAQITEFLTLKARAITKRQTTPIVMDPEFQPTCEAVTARLSQTEGCA